MGTLSVESFSVSLAVASSATLHALRQTVRAMAHDTRGDVARLAFGIEAVDVRLVGGGLALGALHEVAGASPALGDDAAATLFIAGVASRCGSGQVLWAMPRADLFAPGLAQAGLPPSRLIQVETRSDADLLAVVEEGLRHGSLAAVVGEVTTISMTATRRLQLAAEEGGTTALLLRRSKRAEVDPLGSPSAATTRWRIGCAPSAPLPVPGVGRARWAVALERQRGGAPHSWLLEGCDAQGCLAVPAESCDRSAAPVGREDRQAA